MGDDVNFNLIDDINQGQDSVNQGYEANPADCPRNHGQFFATSQDVYQGVQHNQFNIASTTGLTSSSSDPKLCNPSSPDISNSELVGAISSLHNGQNIISNLPIQLSTEQLSALQQQQMLQVTFRIIL